MSDPVILAQEAKELERKRNRFLVWALVVALGINTTWMAAAVVRDRSRTHTVRNLSASVDNLSQRNRALEDTLNKLTLLVQGSKDTQNVLAEIQKTQTEFRRSLDCVALWQKGRPSTSPDCVDVNQRLSDLSKGKIVFTTNTQKGS